VQHWRICSDPSKESAPAAAGVRERLLTSRISLSHPFRCDAAMAESARRFRHLNLLMRCFTFLGRRLWQAARNPRHQSLPPELDDEVWIIYYVRRTQRTARALYGSKCALVIFNPFYAAFWAALRPLFIVIPAPASYKTPPRAKENHRKCFSPTLLRIYSHWIHIWKTTLWARTATRGWIFNLHFMGKQSLVYFYFAKKSKYDRNVYSN
jgi:hypothetical protein